MANNSAFASLDSELHERLPGGMTIDEVIEGAGQPSALAQKIDTSGDRERPVFPQWVMEGTSLYTGLVAPICAVNSKHPELVFMPAMTHLLNTLALQAWPEYQFVIPTVNLGIITPPGQFFKSSSVETAFEYFKTMGLSDTFSPHMNNADGRTVIYCVGSLEGLGLQMARLGNVRAILFNDELGKFVSKASIQASSMTSDLLTLHESGLFQNILKNKRESFSHAAKSYCCSWVWCTTDDNFPIHWGKLAGNTSGLNDRLFFLLGPEQPRPLTPHIDVDVTAGALRTKDLIAAAIRKQSIPVDAAAQREHMQGITESRALSLLLKFAFGFAVDLGRDRIDEDSFRRARGLVNYRQAAMRFLNPIEAETRQGLLQQRMVGLLEKNGGQMPRRDWRKDLHLERYGTAMASDAELGLIKSGRITVSDGTPKIVCLLKETD